MCVNVLCVNVLCVNVLCTIAGQLFVVDDEIDMASVGKANDAIDPEREAYYRDDPKKALQKFFDREGAP